MSERFTRSPITPPPQREQEAMLRLGLEFEEREGGLVVTYPQGAIRETINEDDRRFTVFFVHHPEQRQVIMRSQQIIDPQVPDAAGQVLPCNADTILIAPLGTNFVGAVFVADTVTATAAAVAGAAKYEILEVLPVGIVPGGSHLRVSLRRMR